MKYAVISNMLSDSQNPSYGIFAKRFCERLEVLNLKYDVYVMKKIC